MITSMAFVSRRLITNPQIYGIQFKNFRRLLAQFATNSEPPSKEQGEKTTHFGFKLVNEDEKSEKVYEVFEKVANSYDRMNDIMSFGLHRLWKDTLIKRLNPPQGTKLLDVAGGSGDIAFRFLEYLRQNANPFGKTRWVTVCDINEHMLNVGRRRAIELGLINEYELRWIVGDAECLPVDSDSVSAYTIAFGIRNVTHIDKALQEAYRVLEPGGRFMCLEFSHVTNPILQHVYDAYSFNVIPVMGHVVAGEWEPYQYLVESIRKFPNQETFKKMIENAGFRSVTYENLSFGAVSIHSGFKL